MGREVIFQEASFFQGIRVRQPKIGFKKLLFHKSCVPPVLNELQAVAVQRVIPVSMMLDEIPE